MQNYFISNLFTFCQLKSEIHMVSLHNIQYILILIFSHGTCIIFQILKYLKLKIIFDMYDTCTFGRQKGIAFVCCLTHIQVLNLLVCGP